MTRDEALIKIKKCMALGRSAEPYEAAAALRQAQKLMEMFDLSERALGKHHPNMTTIKARDSRKGKNVSGHGDEGYRQGQGAQLHHGVGQREQAPIGQ